MTLLFRVALEALGDLVGGGFVFPSDAVANLGGHAIPQ